LRRVEPAAESKAMNNHRLNKPKSMSDTFHRPAGGRSW
jgi:hypothetical protein